MNWSIWLDKAWKGLVTTVLAGAIAYAVATVTGLVESGEAPGYAVMAAPIVLHLLGLANNWLKHSDWLK